jgi:hypothetical protein
LGDCLSADVLKARQRKVCQIHCAAPVEEAINLLASNNAASAMVYDSAKVRLLEDAEMICSAVSFVAVA